MKTVLLFLFCVTATLSSAAQHRCGTESGLSAVKEQRNPAAQASQPLDRRHEIRISGSIFPFKTGSGNYWSFGQLPADGSSLDRYHNAATYFGSGRYLTGSFSLEYNYRINRRFDVGMALNYIGASVHQYDTRENTFLGTIYRHYITVMPEVRYTWYRSPLVRLYSSGAAGISFVTGYTRDFDRSVIFAFQLSPVGVEVGRSLFGFAEGGLGAQGAVRIGIGYKFGKKL